MKYLKISQIIPVIYTVLDQPDMEFKSKFRSKLSLKILDTDPHTLNLSYDEALALVRGLRNYAQNFEVWLKIDVILRNTFKNNNLEIIHDVIDFMDILNTYAFKQVQSLEAWQIYTQS